VAFKIVANGLVRTMDIGKQIADFFSSAAGRWTSYVFALSIIGGVTMALLQTIKDLFPVRQWFQRGALQEWMHEGETEARAKLNNPGISATNAETDLLTLAVDGDAGALYDLQIEQLCGQFTAAIQIVLEFPSSHLDLLAITASKSNPGDINILLQPPANPPTPQFVDARTRVTHQCQRAIDAFQISTGFRWKLCLQWASFVLSTLVAGIAILEVLKIKFSSSVILWAVVGGFLAGFLAPVAKDLLAVLQKARGQ
jgi:hypothetical protein